MTPEQIRSRIAKVGECHEWTGRAIDARGYPRVWYMGKLWRLNRLIWMLEHGDIPEGMFVCHKCDNPCCVNPNHLFLGTHTDNMRDASMKGRLAVKHRSCNARSANGSAKLSEDDVREIRTSSKRAVVIAAEFGVSKSAIYKIRSGLRWRKYAGGIQ